MKALLEENGFWASEVIDHGFILSLYAFDPNNIPIEFSYSVPEFDVRAHPIMIDSQPTPAALEGSEARTAVWREVLSPAEDIDVYAGEADAVRAAFSKTKP